MTDDHDELQELRERLRWIVAIMLVAGLFLDRVAPAILGDAYDPLSDIGISAVLASVLVLLGIEGVSWLLKR